MGSQNTIHVKLFASARAAIDAEAVELSVASPITVTELKRQLAENYPALAELLPHVRFAKNAAYVGDDALISSEDEIACIPPVSGG